MSVSRSAERPDPRIARALVLLDDLCEDSLEVPLSNVDAPGVEGDITAKFRELRDALVSVEADLAAKDQRIETLEFALLTARANVISIATDGCDSTRGAKGSAALTLIDAALAGDAAIASNLAEYGTDDKETPESLADSCPRLGPCCCWGRNHHTERIIVKRLVEDTESGLDALLGERVTFFGLNYIYTGKLVGVNDRFVLLEEPSIVYETGPFGDKEWKDAQALPNELYVMLGTGSGSWSWSGSWSGSRS